MAEKSGKRMLGPDLVRILACFTVLSVHFFAHSGFYAENVEGGRMFLMVLMRSAFMICVPLFLLLTGYLMSNKKLEKRYYVKGTKTLVIYLLASAVCILYQTVFNHAPVTPQTFLDILSFKAANYAWYVEMYFGLFLLIPFLNILYHGLPSRGAKRALLGTMLVLTAIPPIVNVYVLTDPAWWANPGAGTAYQQILPQWWLALYPLCYYFIGAYIREYEIRPPVLPTALCLPAAFLINGSYVFWRNSGRTFLWGAWADWGSMLNLIPAVLVFLLLVNVKGVRCPRFLRGAAGLFSELALGIYLVSYVFDSAFYPLLARRVPVMQERLPYYFAIVPAVFLCSAAVSGVMELIWRLGRWIVRSGKRSRSGKETI